MKTIGAAIIVYKADSVLDTIASLKGHVDQIIVVGQTNTPPELVEKIKTTGVEYYDFGDWIDDFAAKRNFSFSKIKTDFGFWCDADDVVLNPENLRKLANSLPEEVGAVWFPYNYAQDEFNNVSTVYERERLLRMRYGWIWQSRLHETLTPCIKCQFVKSGDVTILHNHRSGGSRNDRNFKILNIMLKEEPQNKRVWLYLGHQHFASGDWLKSAEWYLKFGTDNEAIELERFQSLCYASKALREMRDPQAIDTSLTAINLCPQFKDGYLEAAQSYLRFGQIDKALFYAELSEVKSDLITEPPALIFINPMDYTFNRYVLMSDCFRYKEEWEKSKEWMLKAYSIRPIDEIKKQIAYFDNEILKNKVDASIKTLAVQLLNGKETSKLRSLAEATPSWWRDSEDYKQLCAGVSHFYKQKDSPEIVEDGKNVMVNVANVVDVAFTLENLEEKYDKITLVCPYPKADSNQSVVLSQSDIETIIAQKPRHVLNLHSDENRIWCEYDKKIPSKTVRIFLGQGLENWSPKTIREIGCGGSETVLSKIAHEMAKNDWQPILYAMDNEIWDGVLYRRFNNVNIESLCDLFISSRVPDIIPMVKSAKQKWLWVHDISCYDRLTSEIASQIDKIICLSHWHIDHLKRAYPFLKDCEVIDLDDQDKTYEDIWTPNIYDDSPLTKKPQMVILGNAIDTERFKDLDIKKTPHSFIWCSSADRGLEELLNMWPLIKKELPDATLKIFYGWEYFDRTLHIPQQREFKERIRMLIKQDGIEWKGRIGQEQLALELSQAQAMVYPPHSFRETYGIAFLEAQAAGCLVFYRQNGALGETVGNRGVPIPMDAKPEEIVKLIVDKIDNSYDIIKLGREYSLQRSWSKQIEKLLRLYEGRT